MPSKKIVALDLICSYFPDTDRERLMAALVCGDFLIDGETVRDPRARVNRDAPVDVKHVRPVGRGYEKLEAALRAFSIATQDRAVLDAGSSTGGFTQRLLTSGARLVYAVDVGRNQLAWQLRSDPRVVVMEETNVLSLQSGQLNPPPDFAVCDLSFRSLRHVAAHIAGLTIDGRVIALAKPQFEGAGGADFDGVVDDDSGTVLISRLVEDLLAEGMNCQGRIPSGLRGRKGNLEYFLDLRLERSA